MARAVRYPELECQPQAAILAPGRDSLTYFVDAEISCRWIWKPESTVATMPDVHRDSFTRLSRGENDGGGPYRVKYEEPNSSKDAN